MDLKGLKFSKMHGIGNDFVIIDESKATQIPETDKPEACRFLCDRHFGVGADGVLFVVTSNVADIGYRMFNPDGSEAEMCGNGIRCAAQFLKDYKYSLDNYIDILTMDGMKHIDYIQNEIKVHMGNITNTKMTHKIIDCDNQQCQLYLCHMGVNHVIYNTEHFYNVYSLSKTICKSLNEEMNINFVLRMNSKRLKVRTYEKGAGLTLACGTGACASVIIYYYLGLCENCVDVEMLGGTLRIEIIDNELYMYGNAHKICEGEYNE